MLSRENRLRTSPEFDRVFRRGAMSRHPLARLHLLADTQGKKFAIVTSKRLGSAVRRNRARRLFAEALRPLLASVKCGAKGVFVLRPQAASASFAQAQECVQHLLASCDALHAN